MLTVDEFHNKFCCGIRVIFNWRRFFAEDWPINGRTLTSPHDLSSLRLPWYRNEHGAFVNYNAADAIPLSLNDVQEWYQLLSPEEISTIERMKEEFVQGVCAPQFEFPSYALPNDTYMVLDANHRLCALALAKVPFIINMWVVEGPIDPTALADTTFLCSIRP